MGGTNDFETLGFLDIRELDAKGFSTAAGSTPLGSDAMLSVSGSIGSFDRPSIVVELGGTSVTRVDGAAYRPIDFTAGAGTGFSTTVAFEEISAGTTKPDFSVIVAPIEKPLEVVTPAAPSNLAPVFVSGSATGAEDTAISGIVVATDADGDSLTVTKLTDPTHGTVTVHADGSFDYVPAANWHGSDSFDIDVSDGKGGTVTGTVTVTATPVNDAPTAANISVSTNEDTATGGTLAASDIDGDSLTFSMSSGPSNGTASVNASGTWTYTPDADFAESDQFTATVSDGHGGTATVTVDVTVTAVNDAPVVADVALGNVNEDTAFDFTAADLLAAASDVDLDVLSVSLVTIASGNGAVTDLGGGNYRFVPAGGWNGPVSFTFGITDGTTVTTAQATLTVAAVNDAPTVADQGFSADEDTTLNGTLTASDLDGDSLTFSKSTDPAHGTVTVNTNGTFAYTPDANWNGSDSFDFTVDDGNGGIVTKTATVTVDPIADAPNAALADASGTEDAAIALDFTGTGLTDPSETLTVQISGLPADATLSAGTDLGGGVWRLTAAQLSGLTVTSSTTGVHNLTLTATSTESDGATATASDTATLTVAAGNAAPTASDANMLVLQDNPVAFKLRASDPDGNPLTESLHTAPSHGTVAWDAGIGEWLYTPGNGYSGADSFVMQVDDGNGGTATSTYSVQVRSESSGLTVNAESDVVNYDSGSINRPAIAADTDGSYAVFTADYNVAGNLVFFNADGTPTGVNVNVKPGTGTFGGDTDVAYFRDGSQRGIIVKGDESGTTDGNDWGFSISVYGEDGTAVATNVVPYDAAIFANRQYDIGLASLEGANAGSAIVTFQCRYKAGWTYDTWGVLVHSDGTYGTPFQINQATSYAYESDVAALSDGGFVAAWEAADANDRGVYMRYFDSSFSGVTGDILVNTTTSGYQGRPEIAASSSGVVVTWASADNQLRMRTFDTAGNATSAEIMVGSQDRYRWWEVAAHENEYCVVWEAADSNGTGVWMQRFGIADGSSLAAASLVASSETGTQARPDVDYTGDGSLVFAYDDGSVTKIRTRSHTAADNTITFVGTDGGDAVYGSSGADDFQGSLGNDVFFSGGGADVIRFSSIADGEDTLDSVDFTQGGSIVLTGILTAGQIDASHIRLNAVYGSDDTIAFEVDHDGDGGWDRLALLTNAKEPTGAMNGDGVYDAVSQTQLDTALQGLIDGGHITA